MLTIDPSYDSSAGTYAITATANNADTGSEMASVTFDVHFITTTHCD